MQLDPDANGILSHAMSESSNSDWINHSSSCSDVLHFIL